MRFVASAITRAHKLRIVIQLVRFVAQEKIDIAVAVPDIGIAAIGTGHATRVEHMSQPDIV